MTIRIGISGWTYAGWRGVFYPADLPHRRELEFAARAFPTIEINGTHYSLQRPTSFQRWRDETPAGFVFSVKGGRFITHMRRLRDVGEALANFFASGLLALGDKLGPILWQFPPNFRFDAGRFESFLAQLPTTHDEAAALARGHSAWMSDRAWVEPVAAAKLRHCVEIRHESFLTPEFFALLRRHRVAFVHADTAGKFPYADNVTTDFLYLRLHGAEELYVSGYTDAALDDWAARIRGWFAGCHRENARVVGPGTIPRVREVFVYFDNDAKVKAPEDARRLAERLGAEGNPPIPSPAPHPRPRRRPRTS